MVIFVFINSIALIVKDDGPMYVVRALVVTECTSLQLIYVFMLIYYVPFIL